MSKHTTDDYTVSPIILNSSNLVSGGYNNVYRYRFPGSATFKDSKLAVSNVQIYYSWYTISSNNNNNTFSIIIPTGAGTATLSITVPNGSYSISDLNSYIQSQLVSNGYYLVDSNGNYVYYIELVTNSTRYAVQLNCFPVPTALPAGWSNPGAWALPLATSTPQLVVPSTNFQYIIGFAPGTYPSPAQATTYSTISTITPQVSPVSSVILGCNIVSNRLANPQTTLYSFSPGGATYGQLIQSSAYQYSWVSIPDGTYSSIDIIFYDQNFNALQIVDTNLVVFLLIRT